MTETLLDSLALPDDAFPSMPVAMVSAHGEIDTANAHTVIESSLADLAHRRRLILDLTRLEFFGAAGFSALLKISVGCASVGLDWALVPGKAVSRLLGICDPDGLLPAFDTVDAALASLQGSLSGAGRLEQPRDIGEVG